MEKHILEHLIGACNRFLDKEQERMETNGVHYTLGCAIGTIKHIKQVLTENSNNA